jgi:hypothetical protein
MIIKKSTSTLVCTLLLSSVVFTSCGGWSEKEKSQFIEACEVQNIERAYCDCILEKAIAKFDNMAEINNDEKAMAEIFVSADCLEKSMDSSAK